jgi:hypothetical protein
MGTKAAHYYFEVKTISRGQRAKGRSIVACAAYRSGASLKDTRNGKTFNYASRKNDIALSQMLTPEDAPGWMQDAGKVFNCIEAISKRKDARLGREFILSLPVQLNEAQQIACVMKFAQDELVSRGMVAQVSLHRSDTNPHVHLLCATREVEGESFGKVREDWNKVELLATLRQAWADHENAALADAGFSERVDHRSLEARGIDRIPQPKIGVAAMAMLRDGLPDTKRHALARDVMVRNQVRAAIREIQATGEVRQHGIGSSWWEKEIALHDEEPRALNFTRENFGWRGYIGKERGQGRPSDLELS